MSLNLKELLGDNYKEGMTFEEVETALSGIELPKADDNSAEIAKLKESVTRANSEAAQYKKELKAKMSADELKAKEDAENLQKLIDERDALLKDKRMADYRSKFLENQFDADLADKSAKAMVDGDFDTVFSLLGKHITNLEKKFKAENIDRTPKPQGGDESDATVSKAQFNAMGYAERNKLYQENKELYETLSKQ
jgi:hypothetical protein